VNEAAEALSQELFRAGLYARIDRSYPLTKLIRVMPWPEIEGAVSAMTRYEEIGSYVE
jgi:hypothetical protein